MNCVKFNTFFNILEDVERGNLESRPVEAKTSVTSSRSAWLKVLAEQICEEGSSLAGEPGTFPWLPAKRSLKQRQCRSNMKKELEAPDFNRGRMSLFTYELVSVQQPQGVHEV